MKKLTQFVIFVLLVAYSNTFSHDDHMMEHNKAKQMKESSDTTKTYTQQFCPVMGGKIDTTLYYDYNGKRIYVCCKMCLKKVEKNPQKYIDKLESEGIKLEKIEK